MCKTDDRTQLLRTIGEQLDGRICVIIDPITAEQSYIITDGKLQGFVQRFELDMGLHTPPKIKITNPAFLDREWVTKNAPQMLIKPSTKSVTDCDWEAMITMHEEQVKELKEKFPLVEIVYDATGC